MAATDDEIEDALADAAVDAAKVQQKSISPSGFTITHHNPKDLLDARRETKRQGRVARSARMRMD